MPMQCAVQTSILSNRNRWRHLWKYTDVIDFHTLRVSLYHPVDYSSITRCLNLHKALNIIRFSVVSHVGKVSSPDIMKWVDFAVSKGVKVLKIGLMVLPFIIPSIVFKLPDPLYMNGTDSLQQMYLSCVHFGRPNQLGFIGFASVKILCLSNCFVGDATVDAIVANCLLLEVLIIDKCFGLVIVKINGQNLRLKELLVLSWNDFGCSIMLEVDVPSIEILKYWGELRKNLHSLSQVVLIGKDDDTNIAHVTTLITELAKVKLFGASSWLLQFLAKEYYMRDSRCLTFQNLNCFVWFGQLNYEYDVVTLVSILGDCPSLERSQIDFRYNFWDGFCDIVRVDHGEPKFVELEGGMEKLHVGCLEWLKSVEVISFSGFNGEMMLVKLLLKKTVMLQKLQFFSRPPGPVSRNELQIVCRTDSETENEIQKELLQ